MYRPKNTNTKGPLMDEEQKLYDWVLAQRLLNEVGALEPGKVSRLDKAMSGWAKPVRDEELAHALAVDDEDLNSALEAWWNRNGMRGTPITYAEIRAMAAMEVPEDDV